MAGRETAAERKGKILIVDDEPHQRLILEEAIRSLDYAPTVVATGAEALKKIRYGDFDVLLTDMQMPEMTGIQLLASAKRYNSSVSVIICTAHGTIETAVDAIKKGAEDYLLKPIEFSALEITLSKVFKKRELVQENKKLLSENEVLKRDLGIRYHLSSGIGKSEKAQTLHREIKKHMKSKSALLLVGETGVGKEEIARMIHYNSPWSMNDLIEFDCTRVPEDFQEPHLFGDDRDKIGRPGLIEKAHMGTLIIPSIHRLSEACQTRFVRVLKDEKTQRMGGSNHYPAYCRIIATCNALHDFQKLTKEGKYSQEIYKMLSANVISVPPIRERAEDIPILIAATAKRMGQVLGKEIMKIDKPVVDKLISYDFPGNLKELETMVESAVIRCPDSLLKIEHFAFPGSS